MTSKLSASNLRLERKRLGMTQLEMAVAAGVSKSSQVGYESGARAPDLNYLRRIGRLGVDVVFIVFGERQSYEGLRPFDWGLHDRILKTIEDWLDERDLEMPLDKRMELLRLFIAHFDVVKRVDLTYIHDQLAKAA